VRCIHRRDAESAEKSFKPRREEVREECTVGAEQEKDAGLSGVFLLRPYGFDKFLCELLVLCGESLLSIFFVFSVCSVVKKR
jgi:hypothetical protein